MSPIASRTPSRRRARVPERNAICAALALLAVHSSGIALPTGAAPTFGSTSVSADGTKMTIVQGSDRAGIDWRTFSIASGERLNILQPGNGSILFNRVLGNDPSLILGSLQANGRVFLSNPRGVVFGQGSRIDVGSLVATTLNLSDQDMLAGRFNLTRNTTEPGELVQDGVIRATGTVALVAPRLTQSGSIEAPRIGLAAAESVRVDVEGDGLVFFKADTATLETRLKALGELRADGGTVDLRAQARAGFADTVLNLDGIVQARSVGVRNGRVYVDGGSSGKTEVRAQVDATGTNARETGGSVTILGNKVGLFDGAVADVSGAAGGGSLLVGGNYQGSGSERNASATYIGERVQLRADALVSGPGGRVIVWSNDYTRMDGTVSARGGLAGGDGGFAEVSGKELDLTGTVDLAAPLGRGGSLLIDPTDLTIDNTADVRVTATNPFAPNAANPNGSTLKWATVNTALAGAADVTVTTVGSPDQTAPPPAHAGDITITASPAALQGTGTLTFSAAGAIKINAPVTRTGAGAMVFSAVNQISSTSGSTVSNSAAGGGKITMQSTGTGGIALNGGVSSGGKDITLSASGTGDLVIAANLDATAAGIVRLTSATGKIDQTGGTITAAAVGANAATSVSLTGNNVIYDGSTSGVVAGSAADGGFKFVNTQNTALNQVGADGTLFAGVSGVTATVGSTAGNSDVTLRSTGNLTLAQNLDAAVTGIVRLVSTTGKIDQTGGIITAAAVGANAATSVSLTGNNVIYDGSASGVVAGSAADGGFKFVNTQNTALNQVGADAGLFAGVSGVTATVGSTAGNSDVTLRSTGNLTLAQNLDAAVTGIVRLVSTAGKIDQTGGIITAAAVGANAATSVSLTKGNVIHDGSTNGVIAGSAADGSFKLVNTRNTLVNQIGADGSLYALSSGLSATKGVTATNNDITLNSSGNLTLAQNLGAATTGAVRLTSTAGKIDQTGGTITAAAVGANAATSVSLTGSNVIYDGSTSGVVAGSAADGGFKFVNTQNTALNQVGADVGLFAGVSGVTATVGSTAGNSDVTLRSTGNLTLAQNLDAAVTGIVRLVSTTGKIDQTGGIITAAAVGANAATSVSLTKGNVIHDGSTNGFIAGSAADGSFKLVNTRNTLVNQIGADGSLYALTSGLSATKGVTATNNDITLNSSGNLTLAQNLDAATTGAVRLTSTAGKIDQTGGIITAAAVGANAATSVSLTGNNVIYDGSTSGVVAGSAADGGFKFVNTQNTALNQVGADVGLFAGVSGVTATVGSTAGNSDVTLRSTGNLTLAQSLDAAVTGIVRLVSTAGKIDQTGGIITAAAVGANAATSVSLTGNNVIYDGSTNGVIAGSAADGSFKLVNTRNTLVNQIGADGSLYALTSGLSATKGVTATNNDITLHSSGNLSLAQNVDAATTGTARLLSASGSIGQTGGAIKSLNFSVAAPAGSVVLPSSSNAVTGNMAGVAGGTAADFGVKAGSLTIGTVTADPDLVAVAERSGVSATANIALSTTANLAVNAGNPLAAGGGIGLEAGSASNITLNANVDANSLVLRGGSITHPAGTITVGSGGVAADGVDVTSLGLVMTPPKRIAVVNVDAYELRVPTGDLIVPVIPGVSAGPGIASQAVAIAGVSGISAKTVRLQADTGNVRQEAGALVQADTLLGVRAGSDIVLDQNNRVGVGADNTAKLALNAGGNILFKENAGGYTIDAITAGTSVGAVQGIRSGIGATTVELDTVGGEVRQAAAMNVEGQNLILRGSAAYTLANAGNNVAVLAADAAAAGGGAIHYVNANALTVTNVATGSLPSGSALPAGFGIQRSGDVTLRTLAGDLTIAAGLTGADVRLQAANNLVQNAGATAITANALGARAGGDVLLGNTGNGVAGFSAAAGGNILFGEANGYAVNTLPDSNLSSVAVNVVGGGGGIDGTPVYSSTSGIVTGAGRTLELNTVSGEVTQAATRDLGAQNLVLRGAAAYTLANAGNNVAVLAADAAAAGGGAIHYVNANALTVANVATGSLPSGTALPANFGIQRSGDVALRTLAGDLTIAAGLTGADVRLQAANNLVQNAGATTITANALGARAGGDVLLGNTGNGVAGFSAAAGGNILFGEANGYAVNTLPDSNLSSVAVNVVGGGGGIDGTPVYSSTSGIVTGAGRTLELNTVSGEVTQAATRDLGAQNLVLRGAAAYTLANAGNNVAVLAADAAAAGGGAIHYVNANALTVANVATGSLPSGTALPANFGIQRSGDVALRTLAGDLTIAAGLTGADVRLQAANNLVQNAGATAITANALGARAGGDVLLGNTGNGVAEFSAAAGGNILFGEANGYEVNTLPNSNLSSVAVNVAGGGGGIDGTPVYSSTSGIVTGAGRTLELNTVSGEVTQAATRDLGTQNLVLRGAAGYTLANAGNAATSLAASTGGAADGVLRYVDKDALNVASITPVSGGPNVVGITRNNDVGLRTVAGNLTLNESIDVSSAAGRNIELELAQAGSALTQAAGKNVLTSATGGLLLRGPGSVTLTNETNDVGVIAASSGAGDGVLRYSDANALTVGAITPAAGGTAVAGITRNSDVSLRTVAGNLTLNESIDVSSAAGRNIELELAQAGSALTQAAGKNVLTSASGGLLLRGPGSVTLINETNDVGLLAASGGAGDGVLRYTDANALTVGAITPAAGGIAVAGITRNNDVGLRTVAGNLTLNESIDVSSAAGRNIELELSQAGSALTQAAGKNVLTSASGGLLLRGPGSVTLTNDTNDVGVIAASGGTGDGVLRYTDANALTVGAITPAAGGTAVAGITRNNDVGLRTVAGNLTLNESIDVSSAAGRNIELELAQAGSALTQAAGKNVLTSASGGLLLRGPGSVTLTNDTNDVGVIAASSGAGDGVLRYTDANALTVGAITPAAGGTAVAGFTRNNDVGLRTVAGNLTLNESIDVSNAAGKNIELELSQAGSALTQAAGKNVLTSASGGLLLRGPGSVTLINETNDVGLLAASGGAGDGVLRYTDANALTVGAITPAAGGIAVAGIARNNDVGLRTVAGNLTLNESIDVSSAAGRNIELELAQAGSALTQAAGKNLLTSASGGLLLRGPGSVTLTNDTNDVGVIAASGGTGDGVLRYTDANALTVGAITPAAGGTAVAGITRNNDVGLRTVAGNLTLNESIDVSSAAGRNIELELAQAGSALTQAAGKNVLTSASGGLLLRGPGSVTLTNDTNDVGVIAASSGAGDGVLRYTDANALTVGAITPAAGGTAVAGFTRNNDVGLRTVAGNLTLNESIDVSNAAGKNIELELSQAGSALTQAAGKNVLTSASGGLLLRGPGSVTLINETNDVGLLAASGGAGDGVLRYTDANALSVGSITPAAGGIAVAGITRNNDVGLRTVAGNLTLNESIDVSSATGRNIELELTQAGSALTQAAGKNLLTSASGGLLLRGPGSVTLTNDTNDVGVIAASGGTGDGVLRYTDANALTVGAITPAAGGTAVAGITRNNDVGLRTVAGTLTLNESIDVSSAAGKNIELELSQAGSALTQAAGKNVLTSASGGLLLRGPGTVTLTNETNDVGLLAASGGASDGVLSYTDADALTVGSIVPVGGGTAVAGITRNSNVNLRTLAGNLTLTETFDVGSSAQATLKVEGGGNLSIGKSELNAEGKSVVVANFKSVGDLTVTADGMVTFEGNFTAAGTGKTVDITSKLAADADPVLRTNIDGTGEIDLYVTGRKLGPTESVWTPEGVADPIKGGTLINIAKEVIKQSSGTVTVEQGATLRLSSISDKPGSITLASYDNVLNGQITARSAGSASVGVAELASGGARTLSRIEINGNSVNLGDSGARLGVSGFKDNLKVGLEADLVRLGAEAITTGDHYIVARYRATSLAPFEYQLPGLVIEMRSPEKYVQDQSFGAIGDREASALGEGPGLRIILGYDASLPESIGWAVIVPGDFKTSPTEHNGGSPEVLASFRARAARISFSGPVEARPKYTFSAPGVEVNVPVFYNGQTPLNPAQRGALSAIVGLQEKLRREQLERAVSTENVARDLREGVIVEVGAGSAATTGEQGIREPEACVPAAGSMNCGPAK